MAFKGHQERLERLGLGNALHEASSEPEVTHVVKDP